MVNKQRISLREGSLYLDGIEIADAVKCEAVFTPDVSETRGLGDRGVHRRWLGYDITGTITEYRTKPWIHEAIAKYLKDGKTPEFTIQGIQNDIGSDYYAEHGNITKTLRGVILTGDLSLLNLDAESDDVLTDEIEFGAHTVI